MKLLVIAALLLLAVSATATALELPLSATLRNPDSDFALNDNCDPGGGPFMVEVQVGIRSPYTGIHDVTYEYFDFGANAWKDGGTFCIMPKDSCRKQVPFNFGGQGSGSSMRDFLKLKITDKEDPGKYYTKSIGATIGHQPGPVERTILDKRSQIEAGIGRIDPEQACLDGVCCAGLKDKMTAEKSKLQSRVATTDEQLRACDTEDALVTSTMGVNEMKADLGTDACQSALQAYNAAQGELAAPLAAGCAYSGDGHSQAAAKLADAKRKIDAGTYAVATELDDAKSLETQARAALACGGQGTTPSGGDRTPDTPGQPATPPVTPPVTPATPPTKTCPVGFLFVATIGIAGLLAARR